MSKLRPFAMRLAGLFRQDRRDRELTDEIESHLALHAEENMRRGMTPELARRNALLKFGGVETTKEGYRDRRSLTFLESLRQDIAQATRSLRRNPGFTTIAVLTLALGIGGCAGMYAFARGTILLKYPYPDLDSLVVIQEIEVQDPGSNRGVAPQAFVSLDEQGGSIREIAGYLTDGFVLSQNEGARILEGALVTPNVFSILGVKPLHGRVFDQSDPADVVVVGEDAWRRYLGARPEVVGSTLELSRKVYTVVGVMPEGFWRGRDVWMPLASPPLEAGRLRTWARLNNAEVAGQAQAELDVLSERLARENGDPSNLWKLSVLDPFEMSGVQVGRLLGAVVAPVAFVFLIACVNIAHLQFGRDVQRTREMAARLALGAGRGRLVRQLLVESMLLALLGAVLGALFGAWSLNAIAAYLPAGDLVGLKLDLGALPLLTGLAAASVLVIGLLPALRVSSLNLTAALRNGARGHTSHNSFRSLLVSSELALSMMLLIGAGMMVVLVQHVTRTDMGFDERNLWTVRLSLRGPLANEEARRSWATSTLEQVHATPGVISAAVATELPLTGSSRRSFEGLDQPPTGQTWAQAEYRSVSPEYFDTLSIPLRLGRLFGPEDRKGSAPVAIVNETFARQFFAGAAVGRRLRVGTEDGGRADGDVREVVGVVADVRETLDGQLPPPVAFAPFSQDAVAPLSLVARTASAPDAVGRTILERLNAPSPQLIVQSLFSYQQRVEDGKRAQRFLPASMTVFAAFGLFLAGVGLYGTTARAVAQRTRELGVRRALGAMPRDILKLVMRESGRGAVAGMAAGAVASWLAVRLFLGVLEPYERPSAGVDLLTKSDLALPVLLAPALLALVVLAATYIPAVRASRVEPATALRHE